MPDGLNKFGDNVPKLTPKTVCFLVKVLFRKDAVASIL